MNSSDQNAPKNALQVESDASKFEHLASALLSRLLDIPIAVAKSGFQYGGDAGPAGQQGRRFRLECKKYSDTTNINERELLGEIDQALSRDSALEAWLLISTRSVPEQTRQSLVQHGEKHGVPILIIDWRDNQIAPLTALCSFCPELVESEFSAAAGAAARMLQPTSHGIVDRLRRDLESWCLGFETLRKRSHERLNDIWNSPRESNAALGQNAAGGSSAKRIARKKVQEALQDWWQELASSGAPAAVTGLEGTGKTWATLNWLIDNKADQPIILIVPSSAVMSMSGISESNVKGFLAERIYEVTRVRDLQHWHQRLDRLLERPIEEGPVLTVFLDGLNQEPTVEWLRFLKVLQAGLFSNRVRVMVTTRQHHYENKLSKLGGLVIAPVSVEVGRYDDTRGGELDQMLAHEGLARADLHADVLEMARTPRLFDLVVRFRAKLVQGERVTVHRLLWEYGRDTLGIRAERSFSEADWRDWLREIALAYREGIRRFSAATLSETVGRPDLTEREVYARLSDVVDGRLTTRGPSGHIELLPEVTAHALGAALLHHLDDTSLETFDALDTELKTWLDPIAGLDEPSEVLRAAVSILVEQGRAGTGPLTGVLLTAWLQSQNVPDAHRQEIGDLAPELTDALLDAVEHSHGHVHNSARLWAVNGLRRIPRSTDSPLSAIIARAGCWLRFIFRDINPAPNAHKEHNEWRSSHLKKRINTDDVGSVTVIGVPVELTDNDFSLIHKTIPSIIEGFPLSHAVPVFEYAATALAVSGSCVCWDALRWLCLINENDPNATSNRLRELSDQVKRRPTEAGIHPDIPNRVAALLLWLTGQEVDEDSAASLDPRTDRPITYERDYLPSPSKSMFPLERRHADNVLEDTDLPIVSRADRIGDMWLDPTFTPQSDPFQPELQHFAEHFDVDKLNQDRGRSSQEHHFELLEPALARFAPHFLADLIRRKIQSISSCSDETWYWRSITATEHILLADYIDTDSFGVGYQGTAELDKDDMDYAKGCRLLLEIYDLDAKTQFEKIIDADLKFISMDLAEVLRPRTPESMNHLITRYNQGTDKQQRHLVTLLSVEPHSLTESAWSWLESLLQLQSGDNIRGLTFKTLTQSDGKRFGESLLRENWSWDPTDDLWANHYGSLAFIDATRAIFFDQLLNRVAPWMLLEAARMRGSEPIEVRLASEVFDRAMMATDTEAFDPGSDLTVQMAGAADMPFTYSVELRPSDSEAKRFQKAFDPDAQLQALRLAVDIASERIREARKSSAKLYLAPFCSREFVPVIQTAPDIVDGWLEGLSELTAEFRSRVRLAEGAFLALCEALLAHRPIRGVELWRALRECMVTRYVGKAGVDELTHIVFRAPASPQVEEIQRELAELTQCCTDQALLDLAIAVLVNGKQDFVELIIKEDRESPYAWRQLKAKVLEGFVTNTALPVPRAWPEGEIRTERARIAQTSARATWGNACTRHWWKQYLDASDPIHAYSAWVLFVRSADRRVWIWWEDELAAIGTSDEQLRNKIIHASLNRDKIKRIIKKREDKFDQNFLKRKIVQGIGPWC